MLTQPAIRAAAAEAKAFARRRILRLKTIAALAAVALAAGCAANSQPLLPPLPQITINSTTGAATAPAPVVVPADATPLQQIATQLGNVYAADDAGAITMACAGTPKADVIGCNFYSDLAALTNSLSGQSGPQAPQGLLMLVEDARIALSAANGLSSNKLLVQTLVDGIIWVNDTRSKAIAVPVQVTTLLGQISGALIGGVAAPLAGIAGATALLAPK